MDAIRKKMQSLKGETEALYATIRRFEDQTKMYTATADQVYTSIYLYVYLSIYATNQQEVRGPD